MSLLEKIDYPNDLKALSIEELSQLSEEIRGFMIDSVANTGGHLAPSLGAVDFTVALYYCLHAPQDKIVWDVGHQSYSHKILTGRKARFHTLRQKDGISGFPNVGESDYDVFTVGHGSTSISTALGLCAARDLKETSEKIVAVIGDGSLGGGMAFEGLNHAGQLHKDLLIILNDNEFSISPSVGAWSRYLNRVITNPVYNRVRADVDRLIRRVPKLGFRLASAARKLEEGLKNLLVPGMMFEEMGIRYFGPVDGHNIPALVEVINNVLPLDEPRLIHVITKKGKGFKFAEDAPSKFHGTAPFDTEKGEVVASPGTSFTEAFSNKIVELGAKDNRIVAITAAMPDGTGLDGFEKAFPNRFFNVGMAEAHAVGFSAGLAKKGLIPIVAIYSSFLQRAYDQIIHDVALQNLHVVFCVDRAGVVGEDGPTHHGVFDISYLRHIPNLVYMAPKDVEELAAMLEFAVGYTGPIAIRYPRGNALGKPDTDMSIQRIELGVSEMLRAGNDVAIFAIGDMVLPALEAAHLLAQDNIHAEVVNMRFIKPIDSDIISRTAQRIKRFLVVEDNALQAGMGSCLLEVLSDINQGVEVKRLGIPDKFITYGKRNELLEDLGLSAQAIAGKVREWLK
ncbi:MAG: 1-deoxy-D-xylulose-5-phosphate synthase [Candidatus Orphnella occulta]|nr:1-deoxy-D-xylulose-5-phosphate synthase [Candidatus Orphnella occulta]